MLVAISYLGSATQLEGIAISLAGKNTKRRTFPYFYRIVSSRTILAPLFVYDVLFLTAGILEKLTPNSIVKVDKFRVLV